MACDQQTNGLTYYSKLIKRKTNFKKHTSTNRIKNENLDQQ